MTWKIWKSLAFDYCICALGALALNVVLQWLFSWKIDWFYILVWPSSYIFGSYYWSSRRLPKESQKE